MAKATKEVKTNAAPAKETGTAIFVPNKKAMQVTVGPTVAAMLAAVETEDADARAAQSARDKKRYDAMAQLTACYVHIARNDSRIDLRDAWGDMKAVNALNDQLGVASGTREIVTRGEGAKAKQIVVTSAAMADLFPMPGDNKDDPLVRQKMTFRTNFAHKSKLCAQAAFGIMEKDIKFKTDKESGTLLLSGPTVKTTFGSDSVLLNEKQTVGMGDDKVKLKVRPSFTEIARLGAAAIGKVQKTRVQSGIAHAGKAVDPVTAFLSIARAFTDALAKIGDKPDAKIIAAIKSVENAIDKAAVT